MTKQEAIDTLIALAVCIDPKLFCDTDCPFYKTSTNEDILCHCCQHCNANFDINIKKAVETLKEDNK